jgi:hypothetical protein
MTSMIVNIMTNIAAIIILLSELEFDDDLILSTISVVILISVKLVEL